MTSGRTAELVADPRGAYVRETDPCGCEWAWNHAALRQTKMCEPCRLYWQEVTAFPPSMIALGYGMLVAAVAFIVAGLPIGRALGWW